MTDAVLKQMTTDEFLAWSEGREGRWELVNGVPRRDDTEMMAGAKRRHDIVSGNIFAALHARLKGGPCRPYTADFSVRTRGDTMVRRPDVLVECGEGHMDDLAATDPAVVVEVVSPGNSAAELLTKVEEYKALASMRHVVVIEPGRPLLVLYARAANDAWTVTEVEGLDATLALPGIGVDLPMAEIYADVTFGAVEG